MHRVHGLTVLAGRVDDSVREEVHHIRKAQRCAQADTRGTRFRLILYQSSLAYPCHSWVHVVQAAEKIAVAYSALRKREDMVIACFCALPRSG